MGESDRYQEYKIKKQRFTLGQAGNTLVWLFVLNVVFYLVLQTIRIAFSVYEQSPNAYNNDVLQWFGLPATVSRFAERPWTILSYMFSDVILSRAVSNMLWLWAFGSVLQNITGNKKLIPLYLYGGFGGAVFFILANYIFANTQVNGTTGLFGANAAVMSVAVSVTMLAPGYRFFRMIRGGIPIWVLTIFYIAIDLAGVASQDPPVTIAHIGGAAAGFVFVMLLRRGKDGSLWMNRSYSWFISLFDPHANKKKNKFPAKEKFFYNTGNRKPYNKISNITEQRIDEILDKINQKGYHFLTDEEKNILKRASEE
jgi:membrane associated rhomboid family serine protease